MMMMKNLEKSRFNKYFLLEEEIFKNSLSSKHSFRKNLFNNQQKRNAYSKKNQKFKIIKAKRKNLKTYLRTIHLSRN